MAAKKKAAKKAAKPKEIERTVKGSKVTVKIKKKTAKKDMKSCTRIDVGLGNVAEVCVHSGGGPKRLSKAEEAAMMDEFGIGRMSAAKRAEIESDRERLIGTAASDGIRLPRGRRKGRKSRKASKARKSRKASKSRRKSRR